MTDEELVERVAWAIAKVLAKRHGSGHTAQGWLREARREEARAIIPIVQAEQRERDCLPVWFTQLVLTAAEYGNGIKIDAEQVNWLATAIRKGDA